MVESFGEILGKTNKAGLDEVDIRHWIERYLFNLLGSEVRCPVADGGNIVLVSKIPTIRQELYLVINDLREEAMVQISYKINIVKVVRFSG